MAKRVGGRSAGQAAVAVAASGEGVLAGIVDRVFQDPARSGGLMVVAMTATAIICNAMFLQNAHRPVPLFETRLPAAAPAAAVPLPKPAPTYRDSSAPAAAVPQPVARTPAGAIAAPPLPRLSPATKPAQPAASAPASAQVPPTPPQPDARLKLPAAQDPAVALITEIQRGLARLGLYTGAIDGKPGARTSAAIAKYEIADGRPATGRPTPELLHALQAPLPVVKIATPVADPAALDQAARQRAARVAADAQAAAAAKATAAQATAAAAQQAATAAKSKLSDAYRTVQTALNRIGYGPVPVDGTANSATVNAISGFELDNGLPVTGQPNEALTQRLISIGAIKN